MKARVLQSAVIRTLGIKHRPAPSLMYFPGLTQTELIYDNSAFPWTKMLEDEVETIREEFLRLRNFQGSSDYLTKRDEHTLHIGAWDWYSYVTKGTPSTIFEQQCPKTSSILKSIPGFMTHVPFAYSFFSALSAGSKIDPHYSPCNLRLRCHFPLFVPDPKNYDCGMRVGNEMVTWEEGKCIIFDDSFEHETWNLRRSDMDPSFTSAETDLAPGSADVKDFSSARRSKEESASTSHGDSEAEDSGDSCADKRAGRRVILLFDLWHPDLEIEERSAIQDMFSQTLQSMKAQKQ